MNQQLTSTVVDFIHSVRPEGLPANLLHQGRRAFIDTLGVILLGSKEPLGMILKDFAIAEGARPRSLILGSDQRTSPHMAALVNGAAAHAMEYDDACGEGHLSAVLVPAVLAVAEDIGASGLDTLAAFCVGQEVASKIGKTLLGDTYHHHLRGWHGTVANGVMGAAAASAWLLRLNPRETACALGITATHAAGMRKNFGTMTKPFHCGHAAHAGVMAATLAGAGYTASADILDSPLGYFDVLAEGHQQTHHLATLARPWSLLNPGVGIKLYPCCYLASRAADAVLREGGGIQVAADEIAAVVVRLPEFEASTLVYNQPHTGLEGKFSVQYVVAAGLLDGELVPASFTDVRVQRRDIQRLMAKMRVQPFPGDGAVEVVVTRGDGSSISRSCTSALGSAGRPLEDRELREKFRRCAAGIVDLQGINTSLELLDVVETIADIGTLTKHLQPL